MNPDVIRHIVAEVLHRRRIDRREPNRIEAEPAQIIEPCDQATQIAHAVAIAVHERAWVDLVDNAALPPQIGGGALTAVSGLRSEFSRHCQSSGFVFSGSGTSSTAACPGMCQPSSVSRAAVPAPPYFGLSLDQRMSQRRLSGGARSGSGAIDRCKSAQIG